MSGRVAPVTSALYREYFEPAEMKTAGMSSHWRTFAARSTVRVDAAGVPVSASGTGFGDMHVRRPGDALLTAVAAMLHGARYPGRRHVPAAVRLALKGTRDAGLVFNQDALRQALTLALLTHRLPGASFRRVLMIGDGYGLLGALLKLRHPDTQVVFMDLGRSLLFQAMTCDRVLPTSRHYLFDGDADEEAIERADFIYCPADRVDAWPVRPIDLAVNIASMQEMTRETVAEYFCLMRRSPTRWFYCCNREHKRLPGGEVSEYAAYPWDAHDRHLIDEPCPWHQWYLAPRRAAGGVGVKLRIPYDGAHRHRLTELAPSRESV